MSQGQQDKIVTRGLKVDLHIHSFASHWKDSSLVSKGTIADIPTLIGKLKDNKIDMFAITDHDCFWPDIYHKLKKYEEDGSFKKVFPGVEFTVSYKGDSGKGVPVHVIAIFDDTNEAKIAHLAKLLPYDKKPNYDDERKEGFTEETFRSLLREIDLDAVLIAHQKNTPESKNPRDNDANSVGQGRYNEFLNSEYFESYEFKTASTSFFYNLFKRDKNANYEIIRFITGSDCHQWGFYPQHDESKKELIEFTYLKCLPTFRGLAMALTDDSRIRLDDSFFGRGRKYVPKVDYTVKGISYSMPLSKGINAIIGDNSVGKSLILHVLTNYEKFEEKNIKLPSDLQKNYKEYLEKNSVEIASRIPATDIYHFDSQGEIRQRFENGDAYSQSFIQDKYPPELSSVVYLSKIRGQLDGLYSAIDNKFSYDDGLKSLKSIYFGAEDKEIKNVSVRSIAKNRIESTGSLQKLIKSLENAEASLETALASPALEKNDKQKIKDMSTTIAQFLSKYNGIKKNILFKNDLINSINIGISSFKDELTDFQTKNEQKLNEFRDNKETLISSISSLVKIHSKIKDFAFDVEETPIEYLPAKFGDIEFVRRFKCGAKKIDNNYLDELVKSVLQSGKHIDIPSLSKTALTSMISHAEKYQGKEGLELLKDAINAKLSDDFSETKVILRNGQDVTDSVSRGLNATLYFYLISNDENDTGIYIVDQPEDDVSQTSIKSKIIGDLKKMSEKRQIILVTHNPQFVVNLDADNVIFLSQKEGKGFSIESGALEYKEEDYDILNIVSENLEGGIDSLKKRWKRYEKNTNIQKN